MKSKTCDYCALTRPDCQCPMLIEGEVEYSLPDGTKRRDRVKMKITPVDDDRSQVELIPFVWY